MIRFEELRFINILQSYPGKNVPSFPPAGNIFPFQIDSGKIFIRFVFTIQALIFSSRRNILKMQYKINL